MLEKAIKTFEELKKYIFIVDMGDKGLLKVEFTNANFYHLAGFQHTNINMFIPNEITTKNSKYKYIKKNISRFENILQSEIADNVTLYNRISSFGNILDVLKSNNSQLFNLKQKIHGSMYDGDYGLMKLYENLCCLLGLKVTDVIDNIKECAPQSWMASKESNRLIENKRNIFMKDITVIPRELYCQL